MSRAVAPRVAGWSTHPVVQLVKRRAPLPLLACLLALAVGAPAPAAAAPPANDNYLNSIPVNGRGSRLSRETVKDARDTREATVQADLFAPPNTGAGPETTTCEGVAFGKTVWYDFHPDSYGTVELQTAGFDAVVAVYEFDPLTSRITHSVGCMNEAGSTEDMFVPVARKRSYTVQIGGVGAGAAAASGDLQLTFQFFGDLDRDGIFDPLDRCPSLAGVQAQSGCPPELKATPKLTATPTADGITVRKLTVAASKGAKVALSCVRKCSLKESHTAGTVSLKSIRGRALRAGAVLEVRVTKKGAIGLVYRYTVTRGNFKRVDRCLLPGKTTPRTKCP